MKVIVVGLGRFGAAAARALKQNGFDVVGIDKEMRPVEDLKDEVDLAVRADATDPEVLRQHGGEDVHALVAAIGEDFESQILVAVQAQNIGIEQVVARSTTPTHARILEAVGVKSTISPEEEAGSTLARRLAVPNIKRYFELAEGVGISELEVSEAMVGKSLRDLDLPTRFQLNVVGVRRPKDPDEEEPAYLFVAVPDPDEALRARDILELVGTDEALARFVKKAV